MITRLTPGGIAAPPANYSHATLVPPGARWLYMSGQLGVRADGTIPDACAEQAEICFANIEAILTDAGMGRADLVRLTAFLTDPCDLAAYMTVRDRHVADPPPASTLLVVRALARPQCKIEVEAVAARVN